MVTSWTRLDFAQPVKLLFDVVHATRQQACVSVYVLTGGAGAFVEA